MKKIAFSLFFVVLTVITVYSQVPEKINYQAVIRNSSGELVTDQDVGIKVSILNETSSGDILYSEEHAVSTNAYGQVAIEIGGGTLDSGDFSSIDWGVNDKFLKLEVDIEGGTSYVPIGTSQMLSVPYALYAGVATTAELLGTEGVYSTSSDTLFVVKDHSGNVVFVVFPDGAQVIVNESTKGKVGGFAVSGRSPSKADDVDILKVTVDSTRIYVSDTLGVKGKVGGFAVSGRSPSKGGAYDYLVVTGDSTRIYINESLAKGKVGGFAVSGRSPSKDDENEIEYLRVTTDSTIIFIDNDPAKGKVGGFAVSGRSPSKGLANYFNVLGDTTVVINPSEPRVVWFPRKEAFWAGRVLIEHHDSVGFNSMAIGFKAVAKGNNSQSLGYQTRARGDFSTAIGFRTQANGNACFAVGGEARNADGTIITGGYTMADGVASFALGLGANAIGIANTSIGLGSSAVGEFASTAFGVYAKATATRATAIGFGSVASAEQSIAIGVSDTASAYNSLAMGVGSKASGIASMALGSFVEANSPGSFVIGQLNLLPEINADSLWRVNDPLFVVGNGVFTAEPGDLSNVARQNAFTILKNGNMGVGVSEPQRKAHINGVMRLEPQLTPPLDPSEGDIYYDGVTHTLMIYGSDPVGWKTVSWTP
ncbi:MAG: hypothetical protein K8R31_06420 [Bacteroidales bacterium]|nr:hypothetical protein [Bacteroidales bacterium]